MSQRRERDLFELLVREHATSLRVLLRAAGESGDVLEELLQETLVRAWGRLPSFDRSRDFGRWLRGIARNVLREHWRRKAQPQMSEELLDAVDAHCAAFQLRRQDTLPDELQRLRLCMEKLPEHFRAAVHGRYQLQLRGRNLADRLGIGLENAKKRLQRARQLLLGCMQARALPGPFDLGEEGGA